jgi:hypothetical protein
MASPPQSHPDQATDCYSIRMNSPKLSGITAQIVIRPIL